MVWKLKKAIYGLKQASRSWNQCFDQTVQKFRFKKCPNESCVYKKVEKGNVVLLVLYVDDILIIRNNKKMLSSVRTWLSSQFEMKDIATAAVDQYRYSLVVHFGSDSDGARVQFWPYGVYTRYIPGDDHVFGVILRFLVCWNVSVLVL